MNFGQLIRDRRQRCRLSQVELASLSGVSLPTIQNIERHKGNPSLATIESLAHELGLKLSLVDEEIDWAFLARAGLPVTDDGICEEEPTLAKMVKELCKLVRHSRTPRETKALAALLMAMEHHFPDVASRAIPKRIRSSFAALYSEPEVIKLKRIATERLSQYL